MVSAVDLSRPDIVDADMTRDLLEKYGLQCSGSLVGPSTCLKVQLFRGVLQQRSDKHDCRGSQRQQTYQALIGQPEKLAKSFFQRH